jgi:4'-phosphopantetheinyl transferase EntD
MDDKDTLNTYINDITLIGTKENIKASLCLCHLLNQTAYDNAKKCLDIKEEDYYSSLKFDRRRRSYILGKYVAKQAICAYSKDDIKNINIFKGVFNQPIAKCINKQNVQVTITHSNNFGGAIAFPELVPMGIDIEKIDSDNTNVIEAELTNREKELIKNLPCNYDKSMTLLWTIKESLSKALKTGLMVPLKIYEISNVDVKENYTISSFKNFMQYNTISFNIGEFMLSFTYPKNTELVININNIKNKFNYIERSLA